MISPGERGYDLVVIYRSGPLCATIPIVSVTASGGDLAIEITPRDGRQCDDIEYHEAIGFELAADVGAVSVVLDPPWAPWEDTSSG